MKIKSAGVLLLLPLFVLSSCSDGYSQIDVASARTIYENILTKVDVKSINQVSIIIDSRSSNTSQTYERYIFSREQGFYYHYFSSHTRTSEKWDYVLDNNGEKLIYSAQRISDDDGLVREKIISPYDEENYAAIIEDAEFWIISPTNTSLNTFGTIISNKESESETVYDATFYKKDDSSLKVDVNTTYEDTNEDTWPLSYNIEVENNLIKTYYEVRGASYTSIGAKYENVAITYPGIDQFEEVETFS